ncbi:hypothetical protein [Hymenobacter sp. B81]|uniref:hypothetical protein n=1 Tax=Hymenobacter sp. B81 TaxID=3344878 RepID=UPI0037DC3838
MNLSRPSAHWLGMAAVGLAAAGLLAYLFAAPLANLNDYFFNPGGDGLQSYFATAYYALYDQGTRFTGMNYPFGENFTYPNLQPLIAVGINWLQRLGLPAARYTVGITNALALLGLLAAPLVLYAILRRTRLPVWYAGLLALIIAFLSPQVQRLGDHMSLSYACFVPILWYCIIRMQEAPRRWRWYALFVVSSLLMGMVMLYFTACGSIFLLAHVAVLALRQRRDWNMIGRMALTALLPLVLFQVWMWATDPTTDRPPNPFGFLVYMATPAGVFTPSLSPLREVWARFFTVEPISYEAASYVGLVAAGVMVASLLRLAWRLWKQRRRPLQLGRDLPEHLHVGVWAAALVLFFSFAWPFVFPGFKGLVEYLGPIKQFRALGRFAWPFYYVFSCYAAYYLYRLLRYQRQHRVSALALPWLPLLLLVWGAEAWLNISAKAATVNQGAGARAFLDPNTPLLQQLSWTNRRPTDFQAILPLPYFNKGSDRIDIDGSGASVFLAHKLALATGLPELSSYVSRPSIEHVLRHAQLFSSTLIEKPLLRQFPSDKPILLLVTPDALTPAQQRLVGLAKLLVATPEVSLYELPIAALAATTLAQERAKADSLLAILPARPDGLRATTTRGVLYQPFKEAADRRGRLGEGAFHEPKEKFSVLYDGALPAPADTGRYEVSVWVNGKTAYGYGNLQVKLYAGGQQVDHQVADGRLCTEISGDWLRLAVPVRVVPGVNRVEVLHDSHDLLADDLLIRPLDTDVYWRDAQGRPVLNGYQLAR